MVSQYDDLRRVKHVRLVKRSQLRLIQGDFRSEIRSGIRAQPLQRSIDTTKLGVQPGVEVDSVGLRLFNKGIMDSDGGSVLLLLQHNVSIGGGRVLYTTQSELADLPLSPRVHAGQLRHDGLPLGTRLFPAY